MAIQYSIQKMVSDGTLSTIALGIQYLQRNDIYIRIAGEDTPQSGAPSGYTWYFLDNTTLKILPVVPNGVEVVVYRKTDVDTMYNIYSQNAQFDESTIDENNQQLLYIAQEYLEQGLPGAGVDTLEYVRDDGPFMYYRMRRTDGSYSEEFPVPSASNSTKVLTRESLRRSYAEAGYNLVDGSFGVGGTLVNANDVLLQDSTGKVFSGPAGTVAPGTNPVGDADWKPVTDEMLRARLLSSVLRMQDDLFALRDLVSVKDFGAKGDGITDDSAALQTCADYCSANKKTMWWPDGHYRTSGTITVTSEAGLEMATRTTLQNIGDDKSFPAIRITGGGGRRRIIGTIDRYGDGIFLEGNTSNVDFQIISNCIRGVVIAALTSSNLDNVIRGVQIGLCEEGITFLQNGRRVQQGNEVRVNFVSNTKHTLVFDDQGTHTQQSNWDSNLVVLQASDPSFITGATLFWNKSGYAVPALTYAIESWAGGWNLNDNTMTAIKGSVSNCHFTFSFATGLSSSIWCELTNRAGLDSCTVNLKRKSNLGGGQAASYYAATSPGNLAGFNGGVEVTAGVFRIKLSHPDLAAGAVHGQSFYHFLSQTGNGGKFRVRQVERGSDAGKYSIRVQDAGTEYRGMVRTWVTNITSATIPAGDIYIIVECNG